jgi:Rrf2 family protein
MYVTRKADYAVRCVLYLSGRLERTASVEEIAGATCVPKSFTAKILQQLMKAGIVNSVRGVKGGFQLARQPEAVNLLEVIEAIQEASAANICALDRKKCGLSRTCSVHPVWIEIREMVEKRLRKENFATLMKKK